MVNFGINIAEAVNASCYKHLVASRRRLCCNCPSRLNIYDQAAFGNLSSLIYGKELEMMLGLLSPSPEKQVRKTKVDRMIEKERGGQLFAFPDSQRNRRRTTESRSEPEVGTAGPAPKRKKKSIGGSDKPRKQAKPQRIERESLSPEPHVAGDIEKEIDAESSEVPEEDGETVDKELGCAEGETANGDNTDTSTESILAESTDREPVAESEPPSQPTQLLAAVQAMFSKSDVSNNKSKKKKDDPELEGIVIVDGRMDRIKRIQKNNHINSQYRQSRFAAHQKELEKIRSMPAEQRPKRRKSSDMHTWFETNKKRIQRRLNTELARRQFQDYDKVKELRKELENNDNEKALFNILCVIFPSHQRKLLAIRKAEGYEWREVMRDFLSRECVVNRVLIKSAIEARVPSESPFYSQLIKAVDDPEYWKIVFEVDSHRRIPCEDYKEFFGL